MQDLLATDSACFMMLEDLSLHLQVDGSRSTSPHHDLSCISRLTNLRALALQGLPSFFASSALARLPPALTALLLHGSDHVTAAAADFGRRLLRLSQLQCLDVEVAIHGSRDPRADAMIGGQSPAQQACSMRRRFWEGLRPALQDLPLHLGAYVTFDT